MLFLLVTLGVVVSAKDSLPSCDQIPKLLCCTERVIDKCISGCMDYITDKCPHKLNKYDKIAKETPDLNNELDNPRQQAPKPVTSRLNEKFTPNRRPHLNAVSAFEGSGPSLTEGFIEQSRPEQSGRTSSISRGSAASSRDYGRLNQQYPITEVSDADLTSDCGTESSRPPYSPCLSRKIVDDQFLSCCQQHVPSNCHSLCSYEHREHVAAETLIQAVQQEQCDLKYLSNILYCANRNRDNRKCCEFLGLAASELGVGDRCLRMCNIGQSGDRVGTVEKNDLVCLSNWNVLMYCARAGLRTIN